MADEPKPDPMDVPEVLERLNQALALQQRSLIQFTAASGSMFGMEMQAVAGKLWDFAQAELGDTKLLVEKICALGGDPTTDIATVRWTSDPRKAADQLIVAEDETIAALHQVIPPSGQEPRSEALEHLMEHMLMRKQDQVDFLQRVLRGL